MKLKYSLWILCTGPLYTYTWLIYLLVTKQVELNLCGITDVSFEHIFVILIALFSLLSPDIWKTLYVMGVWAIKMAQQTQGWSPSLVKVWYRSTLSILHFFLMACSSSQYFSPSAVFFPILFLNVSHCN